MTENKELTLNNKYLLTISEINFNDCDYQIEGLQYATWGWLNNEFGIAPPKIKVKFDKNKNRYIFNH